jgi:hypothetical protein
MSTADITPPPSSRPVFPSQISVSARLNSFGFARHFRSADLLLAVLTCVNAGHSALPCGELSGENSPSFPPRWKLSTGPHAREATGCTGIARPGCPVHSIIVSALTPDRTEGLQYHVLPTDDPLRALNILREAAGLEPLSDEHDDQGD